MVEKRRSVMVQGAGTWDGEVDYRAMYEALARSVREPKRARSRCYAAMFLLQLRNGLRISKALEAFNAFLNTGREIVRVRVRKRRKPETQLVIVPDILLEIKEIREQCSFLLVKDKTKILQGARAWLRREHKISPRSLRYAFVKHALVSSHDFATASKRPAGCDNEEGDSKVLCVAAVIATFFAHGEQLVEMEKVAPFISVYALRNTFRAACEYLGARYMPHQRLCVRSDKPADYELFVEIYHALRSKHIAMDPQALLEIWKICKNKISK